MNDRFLALQLFVRVARTGSFSAVARETGYSQPSVSRIVNELEKRVGVSLLLRSTRAVTLTEAGSDYLARAESILAELEEADHAARGTGELRGLLRVAMSSSMAARTVLPRLAHFTAPHPALRVEFVLTDERQDLVNESIDLAVRIGPLVDSTGAVARKIGVVQRVIVASPAYLRSAGTPRKPAELRSHALIVGPAARTQEAWTFSKDGHTATVRAEGRFVINGNEAVIAAAVAGLGIASSGLLAFRHELEHGTLVRVLPDWQMGSADVHVVLPAGRSAKPSARAFAQFMASEFQDLLQQNAATP
jgi:DNA-binding transcriptional LysR family regulator